MVGLARDGKGKGAKRDLVRGGTPKTRRAARDAARVAAAAGVQAGPGQVKSYRRRTKSGRVIIVRAHSRRKKR